MIADSLKSLMGIFMAWKGMSSIGESQKINDESHIFMSGMSTNSYIDGDDFLLLYTTTFRPSLAVFNNRLFMAWKGGEDRGIWTADTAYPSDNNLFLDPQRNIPNIGTSVGPSLAVFGNRLFMAWKGVEGDQGVWTSSTADGINWIPQRNIPNIGTSVGPSLAVFWGSPFHIVPRHTKLFMAWKGMEGDQRIWYSLSDDGINWYPQQSIPNIGSSFGPSASSLKIGADYVMVMAWKGMEGDTRIWTNTFDGTHWTPQRSLDGGIAQLSFYTSVGPSLTSWD